MCAGEYDMKNSHLIVFALFLLMLISLSSPYFVRIVEGQPLLFSGEPYYYLRLGSRIMNEGISGNDPLISVSRPFLLNAYPLFLSGIFLFGPPELVSVILPVALGLISFFALNGILRGFGIRDRERIIALALVVLSTLYTIVFARSSPAACAVFLNLVGFFLITRDDLCSLISSFLVFSLVPFFSIAHAAAAIAIMALLFMKKRIVPLILALGVVLGFWISVGKAALVVSPGFFFQDYIADLGGLFGFGSFNLLLAAIGLILTWDDKRKFLPVYLSCLMLLLISIFDKTINIYLIFIFSVAGAIAFIRMYRMHWDLRQVKFLSLMLIVCGLLFSYIAFINSVSSYGPDRYMVDSLEWLSKEGTGVVLTDQGYGFWLQTIAGKKVMVDSFLYDGQVYNDSMAIFHSRNLKNTLSLLQDYNISHILIDDDMKSGLVWQKPNEGLQFLFRNNATFRMVYDRKGVEIWRVLP
jgi:hypothetical protein